MAKVKLEGPSQDDTLFNDTTTLRPSNPAESDHEGTEAGSECSLLDRYTALITPSTTKDIKSENAIENFDFPPAFPTGPTARYPGRWDLPLHEHSRNRGGAFNMGLIESQDRPRYTPENEPSSIRPSYSHRLNPLASTFDAPATLKINILQSPPEFSPDGGQGDPPMSQLGRTPTKAQLNPFAVPFKFSPTAKTSTRPILLQVGNGSQESSNCLAQYQSSVARPSGQNIDDTETRFAEGSTSESSIEMGKCDSLQGTNSEDSDGSFVFDPEVEGFEEPEDISPKLEPPAKDNVLIIEATDGKRDTCVYLNQDSHSFTGSEKIGVDLVGAFDSPGFRAVPDTIRSRYPQMARFLATFAIRETVASHDNPAFSLPEACAELSEVEIKRRNLPIQQDISLDAANTKPGSYEEPQKPDDVSMVEDLLKSAVSQQSIELTSNSLHAPALNEYTREDIRDYSAVRVITSTNEVKFKQAPAHKSLSEELAVSTGLQGGKKISLEISAGVDVRIMPQQDSLEDSQDTIRPPASHRSSISSEGSITFSLMDDDSLSGDGSEKSGSEAFGGGERSRRSPGLSPSPKRIIGVGPLPARPGSLDPLNFITAGNEKMEGIQVDWPDQSSGPSNNEVILTRGRPSVLARMHSRGSNCDDESDSDGVAPGEWVKPIKPQIRNEESAGDFLGEPVQGTVSSDSSSSSQSRQTPQTGHQLDSVWGCERENVPWCEKEMIGTTIAIEGIKPTILDTVGTEGTQGKNGLVILRQGALPASPHLIISEGSLKNYKAPVSTVNFNRGRFIHGSSRGGFTRGGSVIRTQQDTISARWQSFTENPPPVSLFLANPGTKPTQLAPDTTLKNVSETKHSPFEAKVRKLCLMFFNGPCSKGQDCLDLHPNYDEQSGAFTDKRFATEKAFREEASMKGYPDKVDDELETLIKDSRKIAIKKSLEAQMGVKATQLKSAGYQVNNVVVKINEKGQQIWDIEPPTEKQLKEERSKLENSKSMPAKQGKRRY